MEKKTLLHLPHELIIEILLRLPVKSLIRFKCVSKSWFSLISNPYFANSHFQLTTATHTHRILLMSTSAPKIRSIDLEASLNDFSASASLNINFLHPQSYFHIKASCRGFILLHTNSNIYVWNPSTGLHKQIPLSPIDSRLDANYLCYLYGFGYDQLRDDYLVVSVSYDTTLDGNHPRLEFFSLRDNTWKEIEGTYFPYDNNYTFNNVRKIGSLVNGALHWLALHEDLMMDVILAFDLTERNFLEMPVPNGFHQEIEGSDLWVFGEFLSLWAMGEDIVEIWVMKEYKVRSSWTKTLVLSLDGNFIQYFSPFCTVSGDIIGTNGGTGLVKYDDKGQFLEHRHYCNNPGRSQVALYTESLLSLPSNSVPSNSVQA